MGPVRWFFPHPDTRRGLREGDTEIRWIFAFPYCLTEWDMRRMMLLSLLLLTGCQNTIGPLVNKQRGRPDDPYYNVSEQKRLGRDRYSLPDETAPRTGVEGYGPTGR